MNIPGRVQNGVVVLEQVPPLPDGAAVTVSYPAIQQPKASTQNQRIQVPLVFCDEPSSVSLNGARIAELLDEEDASSRH